MTGHSPIKSSSRAGRFKKKLVSEDELQREAPQILRKIKPFHDLFISSQISQADFTSAYILVYLSHRFPGTWLGSLNQSIKKCPGLSWKSLPFDFQPNIMKRLEEIESIQDIFSHFSFKSTPLSVNRAILQWSEGSYDLELMFRIPRPHEVLRQQKIGRRCVTVIMDERISKYILGQRDALSFTMHDLIHADHLYFHNECYLGQLAFYGLLDKTFDYFDLTNEKFADEFEYVISDMNAYAVHLMKCLKSAMIHYFGEDYFLSWLSDLGPPQALLELNTPHYNPLEMDRDILLWLEGFSDPHMRES